MHIDSDVGHHKKRQSEKQSIPLLKTSQIKKKKKTKGNFLGAPPTNTEGKKRFPEKHTAYVQTHILYTSVHPAAVEVWVQKGSDV